MTSLGQNGWKCQIVCITVRVSLQLLRAGVPALRVAVVRARPYTPAGSPPFFNVFPLKLPPLELLIQQ